jgi:hypothetical protein
MLLLVEEVLVDEQVVDLLVDDHEVDVCEKRHEKRRKSVKNRSDLWAAVLCGRRAVLSPSCAVAELCCRRAVLSPSCAVADVSACSAVAAVWAS